ncbi:MAG: DNA polymerase [Nitrosotalea sp.]
MTLQIHLPRSKAKDLTYIKQGRPNRNVNQSVRRKVKGIDSETSDGDIFLICDSDGNFLDYPNITFDGISEFLFKHEDSWLFCYNLQYDAECIMKLLPSEVFDPYRKKKQLRFEYKNYTITYIPKKQFKIQKGNHTVSLYDIAQYYGNVPLADAYSEHIKKPLDQDYLKTKKIRKNFSLRHYFRHKKPIRRYCTTDCILTKDLAEHWLDTFFGAYGFYPANWVSSGYLAEKVLIHNEIPIPFFNDTLYDIQKLAWESFYGGRFELIQRGFIGQCYLYDINSAYPYALTFLPDITDGKWIGTRKINPGSALGFFHIRAQIDYSVKIAPFPFRTKNNRIIYPTGEFETFVTLEELKAITGDPKIKYKIIDSYQFIPNVNCQYPCKKFIIEQYDKRMKLKKQGNKQEVAIKIILNSMYGKTAQRVNNQMGNLFNPVIASYITGFARAQLYKFVKDHQLEKYVVAFATDSIACRKKIPCIDSKKLGEMKLDKEGHDVYFLSNGFYLFNGMWKNRGIGYDTEKKAEIEHLDTKIDKDGNLYITVKTTKTTHIKSGIIYNKLDKIGKIEEYEKKIGLNSDRKRYWHSELKSLKEKTFCDSSPIPIDVVDDIISKKEIEWTMDDDGYEPESEL